MILFFILGFGFGGSVSVNTIYLQEFMMKKHRAMTIAGFGVIDGAAVALLILYFILISKDWKGWYWMCVAM